MTYTIVDSCQLKNLPDLLEEHIGFKTDGSFVEAGASDGQHVSNTWTLAELGWRGLMFEPLPEPFKRCKGNHAGHEVTILPWAISDQNGQAPFYTGGISSTLRRDFIPVLNSIGASLDPTRWITVETITLDRALEAFGWDPGFELLVVDVEGGEEQVLNGFDLDRWHPKMMVWELTELHSTKGLSRRAKKLTARITAHSYRKVYADMLNSVFVRSK